MLGFEVVHHVLYRLGVPAGVRELQQGRNQDEVNRLSVRLELQADCFPGVWANRAEQMFGILEEGDL